MVMKLVLIAVAMLFSGFVAHGLTDLSKIKHRSSAYVICFLCVVTVSTLLGLGGQPCATSDSITNAFLVTILPALLGVRLALGKPIPKRRGPPPAVRNRDFE